MKHVRKIFAFALSLFMAFAIVAPAFAEAQVVVPTKAADKGDGSITIENAAKGATYKIYRLFDATVSEDGSKISYTGTIPSELTGVFETVDGTTSVKAKDTAIKDPNASEPELTEDARNAIADWAKAADREPVAIAEEVAGGTLTFDQLKYGYYVVTTTQANGVLISVDSTKPSATIKDKNTTTPVTPPGPNVPIKKVNDHDVTIGQELDYTIEFNTANYNTHFVEDAQNANAAATTTSYLITEYTIADNFADGKLVPVDDAQPTIKIDGDDPVGTVNIEQWGTKDSKITLQWADATTNTPLYKNGAKITVTYKAKLDDGAVIAGQGNKNTATITYKDTDTTHPEGYSQTFEEIVKTYAIAIKKVNLQNEALKGAKFQFDFYVKATPAADGAYIYAGKDAGEGLINEIETPESGMIVIKGLDSDTEINFTETQAPDGYNRRTDEMSLKPVANTLTSTTTTVYFDANGNQQYTAHQENGLDVQVSADISTTPFVVINKTGAEMPSTGGIGTTIFYIVGGVMVAGAAIFLLTKRRVSNAE